MVVIVHSAQVQQQTKRDRVTDVDQLFEVQIIAISEAIATHLPPSNTEQALVKHYSIVAYMIPTSVSKPRSSVCVKCCPWFKTTILCLYSMTRVNSTASDTLCVRARPWRTTLGILVSHSCWSQFQRNDYKELGFA